MSLSRRSLLAGAAAALVVTGSRVSRAAAAKAAITVYKDPT